MHIRKCVAVFLAIWLPLFSGSAFAISVGMQMQRSSCHGASMRHQQSSEAETDQKAHTEVSTEHHQTSSHNPKDLPCKACGVCHFACNGSVLLSNIDGLSTQQADSLFIPNLFSFHSISSTPLLHPPSPV